MSKAAELVARGRELQREQRNTSALAAYEEALRLDPSFESAWMRKAMLLEELERLDEALAAYDGLLEHHPGHAGGWSNRAGLLLQAGRFDEALHSLDHALEVDPGNVLLCLNKGLLLLQAYDQPAEALPWLEKALSTGMPEAAEAVEICREALQAQADAAPQA